MFQEFIAFCDFSPIMKSRVFCGYFAGGVISFCGMRSKRESAMNSFVFHHASYSIS